MRPAEMVAGYIEDLLDTSGHRVPHDVAGHCREVLAGWLAGEAAPDEVRAAERALRQEVSDGGG